MDITNKLTKQIDEMRYVTVENTWRYRSLSRCFYHEGWKGFGDNYEPLQLSLWNISSTEGENNKKNYINIEQSIYRKVKKGEYL